MKYIDMFEKNNKDKIIINMKNVMKIMYLIVVNEVTNVRHYLKTEFNIDVNMYQRKLKEIETKYPDYYKFYKINLDNNIEIRNENLKNILLYIDILMRYGVELEDGTFREFDIFDWYQIKNEYFDNLNRKEISDIIDNFAKDNYSNPTKFDIYSVRVLISQAYRDNMSVYNYSLHRDEFIQKGSFGLNEKEAIKLVEFMEKYNIPSIYENYRIGTQKMINQRQNNNDIFNINLQVKKRVNKR